MEGKRPVSSLFCCQCLCALVHGTPHVLGHLAGEEGPALGFLSKSLSSHGAAAGDKMTH